MRILLSIIFIMSFATLSFAAAKPTSSGVERQITVGGCTMNIISMQTPNEHANGLLGYTEDTFAYDGMLFDMKRNDRKYFHTMGMKMPIRIMGVEQVSADVYKVVGPVRKAPPGIRSIEINAPDVFEIPEAKYLLRYRACLNAAEE
ncbi:MAG: hypothetical protein LBV04_02765 [Deferribacteraceae bacterium]|jgi:uncharacterized membrane protein (UPF0127 family)|nr:hypothetical protein [Deferribacteraceae bacterium]